MHKMLLFNDGVETIRSLRILLNTKTNLVQRYASLKLGAEEGKGMSELVTWDTLTEGDVEQQGNNQNEEEGLSELVAWEAHPESHLDQEEEEAGNGALDEKEPGTGGSLADGSSKGTLETTHAAEDEQHIEEQIPVAVEPLKAAENAVESPHSPEPNAPQDITPSRDIEDDEGDDLIDYEDEDEVVDSLDCAHAYSPGHRSGEDNTHSGMFIDLELNILGSNLRTVLIKANIFTVEAMNHDTRSRRSASPLVDDDIGDEAFNKPYEEHINSEEDNGEYDEGGRDSEGPEHVEQHAEEESRLLNDKLVPDEGEIENLETGSATHHAINTDKVAGHNAGLSNLEPTDGVQEDAPYRGIDEDTIKGQDGVKKEKITAEKQPSLQEENAFVNRASEEHDDRHGQYDGFSTIPGSITSSLGLESSTSSANTLENDEISYEEEDENLDGSDATKDLELSRDAEGTESKQENADEIDYDDDDEVYLPETDLVTVTEQLATSVTPIKRPRTDTGLDEIVSPSRKGVYKKPWSTP